MSPPRSKPARVRLEGVAGTPIGEGNCMNCRLKKEVFGTATNQGYIYLCRDCLRKARKQAKRKPRSAFENAQNAKDKTDALKRRIPGSYEMGKKR